MFDAAERRCARNTAGGAVGSQTTSASMSCAKDRMVPVVSRVTRWRRRCLHLTALAIRSPRHSRRPGAARDRGRRFLLRQPRGGGTSPKIVGAMKPAGLFIPSGQIGCAGQQRVSSATPTPIISRTRSYCRPCRPMGPIVVVGSMLLPGTALAVVSASSFGPPRRDVAHDDRARLVAVQVWPVRLKAPPA